MHKHRKQLSLVLTITWLAIWSGNGCATKNRVIVVNSAADVVRAGKGMRGQVYVYRNGQWVDGGVMTIPEGWYAGPGPTK